MYDEGDLLVCAHSEPALGLGVDFCFSLQILLNVSDLYCSSGTIGDNEFRCISAVTWFLRLVEAAFLVSAASES
jgi:hypothetical protein